MPYYYLFLINAEIIKNNNWTCEGMLTKNEQKFTQALQLAEKGSLPQSLSLFEQLAEANSADYCAIVNYGVLCLQQGRFVQARRAFRKAIELDCYEYLAYYNMFLLGCHELTPRSRFQSPRNSIKNSNIENNNRKQILQHLYLALSCLYADLGQAEQDIKLCTKALSYSEENSYAYINRAELYERDGKLALAENDYSSAIYYNGDNGGLYMKRAQFYWKRARIEESNADILVYLEKKNSHPNPKALASKEITQEQLKNFEKIVQQKCLQLYSLLGRIRDANQRRQENWIIHIPTSPRSAAQIPSFQQIIKEKETKMKMRVRVSEQSEEKQEEEDEDLLMDQDEGIDIVREGQAEKELSGGDGVYMDESSKNISQEIEKLEKQIRMERGKARQEQSQSQSRQKQISNQQTFLTAEIEKTAKQIQTIRHSQHRTNRTNSASSNQSHKYITVEQLRKYKKIILEIISAQYFDSSNKQQSKVYLSYGKQKSQTGYSKNNFWREKIQFNLEPALHKDFPSALDSDEEAGHDEQKIRRNQGEVRVELQMKSKSVWNSKKIIGISSIDIQQLGENKCILSNQKEKTGIVYFKLKII